MIMRKLLDNKIIMITAISDNTKKNFAVGFMKTMCVFAHIIVVLTMVNHFWGFKQLIKYQATLEDLKKKQEEEVFRISREEAYPSVHEPVQPAQMDYIYDPEDVAISESIFGKEK